MRFLILIILSFAVMPVAGQENYGTLHAERVFLHTDRNTYIAGEYLFYKMYLQGNPEKTSRYAYLLIRDQNNSVVTHIRMEISNHVSFGHILLSDTLSSGYYQVLCYTNLMRNYEENIFTMEIAIANRFDENLIPFTEPAGKTDADKTEQASSVHKSEKENIHIKPERQVYNSRDKIVFSVEPDSPLSGTIESLSVSVSEIIPGIPDDPFVSDYFDGERLSSSKSDTEENRLNHYPEYNRSVLQGKVMTGTTSVAAGKKGRSSPVKTSEKYTVLLSSADSAANLLYSFTDSLGSFCFNLDPYYEGKDVIIKLREKADASIIIDNKTSISRPFIPSLRFSVPGIKEYLIRCGQIAQVHRFYNYRITMDTLNTFVSAKIIPRIYYKHYQTILPSDFVELNDFTEISREIVPGFKVRKTRDRFVSGYSNIQYKADPDAEPAIFLDGVPIDDVNQIIHFSTMDIKSIETVSAIRVYGEMTFPGILSVISSNKAVDNIEFTAPAVRFTTLSSQCFTRPEPFTPASLNRNFPDLRQVLLWEPDLRPDNNTITVIECFASDLRGLYRIDIQGITTDGFPLHGSAVISIRPE